MSTFRETTEETERMTQRLRRLLEKRHAMHIGEIVMRLGVEEGIVRAELEGMILRGEVERLRPIAYPGEDRDFFRLDQPGVPIAALEDASASRSPAWKCFGSMTCSEV
jgi:predicted ArsR family transcriptional regulator